MQRIVLMEPPIKGSRSYAVENILKVKSTYYARGGDSAHSSLREVSGRLVGPRIAGVGWCGQTEAANPSG